MKISDYQIEFLCKKCGSGMSTSGEKLYKDLDVVLDKTEVNEMCHACGTRSITFSHLHAKIANEEDAPKILYELSYKCESCGVAFTSNCWIKKGDTTPFKDPKAAGITCVRASCVRSGGSKLHLNSCRRISG